MSRSAQALSVGSRMGSDLSGPKTGVGSQELSTQINEGKHTLDELGVGNLRGCLRLT
jgi:hypothetical protein